jgi:hypothetical protein
VLRGGTAPLAHRYASHSMISNKKAAWHLAEAALGKNMQSISTLEPKTVASRRLPAKAARPNPAAEKQPKIQPGNLTREELRQIIIDMIG